MSAPCLLWCRYIFSRWRYYFICHVTQQDLSVEMPCVFMGESSTLHVTTLKSLVTIGILIVVRISASSKTSYKYVLTLKNWVDGITTRREKHVTNTKMVDIEKKCPEIKNKHHIFLLMTTFHNFTLKMETSWDKNVLKPILKTWNPNDAIVYVWFIYSRIKTN